MFTRVSLYAINAAMNLLRRVLLLYISLIWPILVIVRWWWDFWVETVMKLTVGKRRRGTLPPVFNPLLLLPATVLAENIRQRKMTSLEIVRAFVTRCSDVNPLLNAIVQENFQEALQCAKEIDDRISEGYRNGTFNPERIKEDEPFLGVPFTVKETIAVEGFPHTAGLLTRSEERAEEDAVIVSRMRSAGAIVLATTNVSELGMWWETSNPLYGRTTNPYDTRRTPGGSSGGEASLMCSCGSPISIGTDTGGSIRTPAFFCGLFGHKPTAELVPVIGCNLQREGEENMAIQVAGPITRHAADIAPVLKVLAGEKAYQLELEKPVHVSCLRFYYMEDDGNRVWTSPVAPVLKNIMMDIKKYLLVKYDLIALRVKIRDMRNAYWIWTEKMKEDYANNKPMYMQLVNNQGEVNIWTEMLRSLLGRARHSFASLLQVVLEKIIDELNFLRDQKNLLEGKTASTPSVRTPKWRELKMVIQRLLGDDGILLFPSHPTLAPFHRESYLKPFNFVYTAIFNALGFPVTQVPLGLDPETGLPLGIQVVGGVNMDRLTIAVAKELETAFGGWKCPAKIL